MKKKLKKMLIKETGAVTVLVAAAMVALLGFAAFAIDLGVVYNTKAKLQNTADAAALAAAQDLPYATTAINTADIYAEFNNVLASETSATTPYNGDNAKIEVVCTRNVSYLFARVLGFSEKDVSARAVAYKESHWTGDALPFINLDDDYLVDSEIVAWEDVAPGDFESIDSDDYEIINADDPDTCYFKVDYLDGVILAKGTVATVKQEVGYIFERVQPDIPVYTLSLSSEVMNSGQVLLTDGSYQDLLKLENENIIDSSQFVLLECLFYNYDYTGKTLYLTVLNVYDIMNNEFPPDYVNPDDGVSLIVE